MEVAANGEHAVDSKATSVQSSTGSEEQVYLQSSWLGVALALTDILNCVRPTYTNTQVLVMNNERIVIPEILFHPSDIGELLIHCPSIWLESILS